MHRGKEKYHICYRFKNQGSVTGPGIKYDAFAYDNSFKIVY